MPTIVPLTVDHAPQILAIWNREIREGYAHFGEEELTLEAVIRTLRADLRSCPAFAAISDEGEFMGFAKSGKHRSRSAYRYAVEASVYVDSRFQRQGIGRELLERLIVALARKRFPTILAGIALPNEGSVRLFESLGFVKVGHFPEVGFKQDRWIDVGYWAIFVQRKGSRQMIAGFQDFNAQSVMVFEN